VIHKELSIIYWSLSSLTAGTNDHVHDPIANHMHPVHSLPTDLPKNHSYIFLPSTPTPPGGLFPSHFAIKSLYVDYLEQGV